MGGEEEVEEGGGGGEEETLWGWEWVVDGECFNAGDVGETWRRRKEDSLADGSSSTTTLLVQLPSSLSTIFFTWFVVAKYPLPSRFAQNSVHLPPRSFPLRSLLPSSKLNLRQPVLLLDFNSHGRRRRISTSNSSRARSRLSTPREDPRARAGKRGDEDQAGSDG